MLKTKKSTTLTGQSMIGEQQVIYLTASITNESAGNTTINQSIENDILYKTNLAECRADVQAFQAAVWATEDAMIAEQGNA